jgi:hypothetical protein
MTVGFRIRFKTVQGPEDFVKVTHTKSHVIKAYR